MLGGFDFCLEGQPSVVLLGFVDVGFVIPSELLEGAVEIGGVGNVIDHDDLDFQTGFEAVDVTVDLGLGLGWGTDVDGLEAGE